MVRQAHDVEESGIVDEDDFVVIEQSAVTLGMMEIEHQSGGFFQLIRNYLASPSTAAFEQLQEELEETKSQLAEAQETVEARDKEIIDLKNNVDERNEKISALTQRFQVVKGVTSALVGLKSPELVDTLLTEDVMKVGGLALPKVKNYTMCWSIFRTLSSKD